MGLANKNVLLIDNEDSFTYNLIQLIEQNNYNVDIISGKDKYKPECNSYKYILFSPGPGIPNDFPLMKTILNNYHPQQKILGICLGHQAIAQHFGARLFKLTEVTHGIKSQVKKTIPLSNSCLCSLPLEFEVARYHSWAVDLISLPEIFEVSCTAGDIIMGLCHKKHSIEGIQFHPESFLTDLGPSIINNWLK